MSSDAEVTLPCAWQLRGRVIHGHGRGGKMLGCPTANIALDEATTTALKPFSNHVLYGWGCIESASSNEDKSNSSNGHDSSNNDDNNLATAACDVAELGPWPVVLSVGYNPHFRDKALTVEVHFLHSFDADFYDKVVRIYVIGVVREQRCFDSLQALIDEIDRDKAHATRELASVTLCAHQHDRFVQPLAPLTREEAAALPFLRLLDKASVTSDGIRDNDDSNNNNKQ